MSDVSNKILSSAAKKAKQLIKEKKTLEVQQQAKSQAQQQAAPQNQTQNSQDKAKETSVFNNFFKVTDRAFKQKETDTANSADDARKEQRFIRFQQGLQEIEGYQEAYHEYYENSEKIDTIPQTPEEITNPEDLCRYFGYGSINQLKDATLKEIVSTTTANGIPEDIATYIAKEVIIEELNSQNGSDDEVSIEPDDDGRYVVKGGKDDGLYISQVITEGDFATKTTDKYEEYLRAKEPEKFALANTVYDNPKQASRLLIQSYGGDGETAAKALQEGFNNYNGTTTGLFEDVNVRYDSDTGEILITNDGVNNGIECSLSDYIEKCREQDTQVFGSKISEITFKNVLIDNSYEIQTADKDNAISSITSSNKVISEDIEEGSELTQALYNAETKNDAYDVILTYCANNREVADNVYNYLIGSDTKANSNENPFHNRDTSSLTGLLYSNVGDKYVLNQDLLDRFEEVEAYDYKINEDTKEPELLKRPKKEYYTNLNGELCTRNWTYSNDNGHETIKISLEENNSTRELEFYNCTNSIGETIYYIKPSNENEQPIVETQDQFFKRLAVAQNYSVLQATNSDFMQDGSDMSTEKIAQYYAILAQYDKNTSETLATISRQFSSEGIADDAKNWLSKTFDIGVDKDEVLDEVSAQTKHSLIMSYYINQQNDTAQAMVQDELERRLNSAENYQQVYDTLLGYYGDRELALEIMNSSVVLPQNDLLQSKQAKFNFENDELMFLWNDDFGQEQSEPASYCNKSTFGFIDNNHEIKIKDTKYESELNQEQAYRFLCNGGNYTEENVEAYNTASEQFTDYNTSILTGAKLADCTNPEDAFYLITGKHVDDSNLTDEDIQKFNDTYSIDNSNYKFSGDMETERHIGVKYDRENGFQLLYKDDKYHKDEVVINIPIQDTLELDYYNILPNEVYSAFCDEDAMKKYGLSSLNENYFAQQMSKYKQEKFEEYYGKNKDQVDLYIDNYAQHIETLDKDSEEYKYFEKVLKENGYDGVTKENISAYINKNPDTKYEESCKFMQYAYTNAKQGLFGESRLDNITNQYCMDMASYSSNLSHMLSMGCMIGSVLFPAAAPVLMMGAKAAGYVDNTIDFINMLTNRQNYLDDDYIGLAKSTGFEWLTKRGYNKLGNIAGDNADKVTKWLIDKTGGSASYLANHALAQILVKGSLEAVIETGACIPWTMGIKAIQGGEYNLLDELKENFIYDFLPYARGWQDLLIGKGDTTLYGGDNKYYRWQNGKNGEERIYVDSENPNRILGITSVLANGSEIDLVKYDYNDNGSIKITEYENDGKTVKQVKVQENNGNKTTYYKGVDEEGKPVNPTKTVVAEQSYDGTIKITTTEEGKPDTVETRDSKGRIMSLQQGNTLTEFNTKTGQKENISITTPNGKTATISYQNIWGGQVVKIQTSDGSEFSYKINSEGKAVYEPEGDDSKPIVFDEKEVLNLIAQGKSVYEIEKAFYTSKSDRAVEPYLSKAENSQIEDNNKINDSEIKDKENKIAQELGYDTTKEYTQEQKEAVLEKMLEDETEQIVSEKARRLIQNENLSPSDAYNIARQVLTTNQEEKCIELHVEKGIPVQDAVKLIQEPLVSMSKPNEDFVVKLYQEHNIPVSDGLDMLKSGFKTNPEALAGVVRIFEQNDKISVNDATKIYAAKLDSIQEEKAVEYIADYGISSKEAVYLASLDGDFNEDKVLSLISKDGIYAKDAVAIAKGEIPEEEYKQAFNYFNSLVDSNGEKIFDNSQKISYMINVAGDSSAQSSNIDLLTSYIQDGTIGKHIFNFIPELGKPSEKIDDDIDRMIWALEHNRDVSEGFVPKFESLDEVQSAIDNEKFVFFGKAFSFQQGDVFEMEGNDKLFVVETDGSISELNMDKQTYMTLFPPVERFATTQNKIGNCWEISGINSLVCNDDTRAYILKMFSQDENGDITVTLPGNGISVTYKNLQLPDGTDNDFYSIGAMGVRMIEYANGVSIATEKMSEKLEEFSFAPDAAEKIKELYEAQGLNINIDAVMGEFDMKTFKINVDVNALPYRNNRFDSVYSEYREGGQTDDLFRRLGLENPQRIKFENDTQNAQKVIDILSNPESFDKLVICAGTTGSNEASVNSELGIAAGHEYRVNAGLVEDGEVKTLVLTNPWGTYSVEISQEEFIKYFGVVHTADKPQAGFDGVEADKPSGEIDGEKMYTQEEGTNRADKIGEIIDNSPNGDNVKPQDTENTNKSASDGNLAELAKAGVIELAESKYGLQGCQSCEDVLRSLKENGLISKKGFKELDKCYNSDKQETALKIMLISDFAIDAQNSIKLAEYGQESVSKIAEIFDEKLISPENFQKLTKFVEKPEDIDAFGLVCKTLKDNVFVDEDSITTSLAAYLKKQKLANSSFDITGFSDYVKDFNFESLKSQFPIFEKYDADSWINFLTYHCRDGKVTFTEEDLSVDLTAFLKQNFLDADNLSEFLDVFPYSQRTIGNIPSGWSLGIQADDVKLIDMVDASVVEFIGSKDTDKLADDLSKALGKKVTVEGIGSGKLGVVYKVSVDGAEDTCIKIFYETPKMNVDPNVHGGRIEPQTALFANEHSNDFVRMYMGHVASESDPTSYMITQYLSDESIVESTNPADADSYVFKPIDDHDGNYFQTSDGRRIFFDFGAVKIDRIDGKKTKHVHYFQ